MMDTFEGLSSRYTGRIVSMTYEYHGSGVYSYAPTPIEHYLKTYCGVESVTLEEFVGCLRVYCSPCPPPSKQLCAYLEALRPMGMVIEIKELNLSPWYTKYFSPLAALPSGMESHV